MDGPCPRAVVGTCHLSISFFRCLHRAQLGAELPVQMKMFAEFSELLIPSPKRARAWHGGGAVRGPTLLGDRAKLGVRPVCACASPVSSGVTSGLTQICTCKRRLRKQEAFMSGPRSKERRRGGVRGSWAADARRGRRTLRRGAARGGAERQTGGAPLSGSSRVCRAA